MAVDLSLFASAGFHSFGLVVFGLFCLSLVYFLSVKQNAPMLNYSSLMVSLSHLELSLDNMCWI